VFPNKNIWLAVLFAMFMHGSILHVLGNMLFLWIFGNNVEDRFGSIWYLVFYLAMGVVATATHVAFNASSTVPTIGASGAIAGVMGAYIVWWPHARVLSFVPIVFFVGLFELPAAVVLGIWFVTQFFTNPNEGVAWLAHVGGFTAGALLALTLRNVLPPSPLGPGRTDEDRDTGFGGGYPGRL
jgi:membrane associated rhomboid family serine protease